MGSDPAFVLASDGDQDWTKVEFTERRRTPYTFNAQAAEASARASTAPGAFPEEVHLEAAPRSSGHSQSKPPPGAGTATSHNTSPSDSQTRSTETRDRTPRSRTCRICLEVVHPVFEPSSIPSIPGMAPKPPRFVYEDPELGRLISPCKCRGSSRYVHEGCLRQWRMTMPSSNRNYWHCPTCGYNYHLERLTYARYLQSVPSQLLLTAVVFVVAMFFIGFIADPIINLYLDPWSIIGWGWTGIRPFDRIEEIFDDEPGGWYEHFFKGMAGLGVLGFLKFFLASPFSIYRMRVGGGGNRTGATGRDRMESLSWIMILIGVGTALLGIYKGIRIFSRRALMRTAERVLDIGDDDDDDGDDDDGN